MAKVGRPRQLDLITLDTAVEIIRQRLWEKYKDERIVERKSYSKGTLYNKIYKKQITNHGDRKCVLVEKEEILKLCA